MYFVDSAIKMSVNPNKSTWINVVLTAETDHENLSQVRNQQNIQMKFWKVLGDEIQSRNKFSLLAFPGESKLNSFKPMRVAHNHFSKIVQISRFHNHTKVYVHITILYLYF